MYAASSLIEDNSNSPNLFCYKQSSQTAEPKNGKRNDKPWSPENYDSKSEVFQTKKEKSPKIPLNSKRNDLQDDSTPGPGTYSPGISTMRAIYRTLPSYTFGLRHTSNRYFETSVKPGPANYSIGGCFCDKPLAPRYSLSRRHSWYKAPFIIEYK